MKSLKIYVDIVKSPNFVRPLNKNKYKTRRQFIICFEKCLFYLLTCKKCLKNMIHKLQMYSGLDGMVVMIRKETSNGDE